MFLLFGGRMVVRAYCTCSRHGKGARKYFFCFYTSTFSLHPPRFLFHLFYFGCIKRKSAFEHAQNGQMQIILSQPPWLSWMRVRLVIRRLRVHPLMARQHSFVEIGSWNIFYSHSLPSADSKRAVVSFWGKNVHNTGTLLRGLSLPSKSVAR